MCKAREMKHFSILKGDRLIVGKQQYTVNTINQLPDELQPAKMATRKENNVLAFFTGATPLSNFYKSNFQINNRTYSSVEQYFQYCKAVFAEDKEAAKKILDATFPAKCKYFGKSVRVNQDQWLAEAKTVMLKACTAKFEQDLYARQYLKDTGNYVLAEASLDPDWGIGKRLHDKDISKKDSWTGQNLLGLILMQIRDNINSS